MGNNNGVSAAVLWPAPCILMEVSNFFQRPFLTAWHKQHQMAVDEFIESPEMQDVMCVRFPMD